MCGSEAPVTRYSVEISPSAWRQLARLTVETYRRIRGELDAVAAALTAREPGSRAPTVVVDDAVARYHVDHLHRRVKLLDVERPRWREAEAG